jgi:hypothetical protein
MQALMASSHPMVDQTWYPDLGTSPHITSDLANLDLKVIDYGGSNQLCLDNGIGLSIHVMPPKSTLANLTKLLAITPNKPTCDSMRNLPSSIIKVNA